MKYLLTLLLGLVIGFSISIPKDVEYRLYARSYELGCSLVSKDYSYCKQASDVFYSALTAEVIIP